MTHDNVVAITGGRRAAVFRGPDMIYLAELSGLNDEDAEEIARRVLQARLADAQKGSQQLVDTYSTYLALKQRFEYAEE